MTAVAPDAHARASRRPEPRTYLMCPPRHFTVSYAINPWMDPDKPVSADVAMAQWTDLRDTYRALGHTVHEIEPVEGLPDMVFAANSGTVVGGRVLGARFRAAERQPEAEHYRRWFVEQGFRDVVMPGETNEGEGDLIWTGSTLLAGTGFRTVPAAHTEAGTILDVPVVTMELVDPRYYHMDTALMVLATATEDRPAEVAYFPGAFSADALHQLERMFPDAVLATEADAEAFGLNGVSDGRNVILADGATGLAEKLADRGFEPALLDMSELRKAGGGPKCCTLELRP